MFYEVVLFLVLWSHIDWVYFPRSSIAVSYVIFAHIFLDFMSLYIVMQTLLYTLFFLFVMRVMPDLKLSDKFFDLKYVDKNVILSHLDEQIKLRELPIELKQSALLKGKVQPEEPQLTTTQ